MHENERYQAGDVAAYSLLDGGTRYSGHTGLIMQRGANKTNISAHGDAVYTETGQFENYKLTVYRRYIGG